MTMNITVLWDLKSCNPLYKY